MFNIGDIIIYSAHGLCKIDDICEKTLSKVTRTYYVLQPLEQSNLTINVPVSNESIMKIETMDRAEANVIAQSFKKPGLKWIENARQRMSQYNVILQTGDRQGIAKISNTLMRKQLEYSGMKKRLTDSDLKLLDMIQKIFFKELAMSLSMSEKAFYEQVECYIKEDFSDLSAHTMT